MIASHPWRSGLSRRSLLAGLGFLGACALPQGRPLLAWAPARGSPRNIVIVMADDMGYADLGCFGSEVPTPNLDRLASRGMRFTQFHSTGKCFPSRSALLTGLYPQQTGTDRSARAPMQGGVTIAESLRAAGYRTLMVGKHHSTTHPMDRGFDHYRGLRDGSANYFNPGTVPRMGEPEPARKEPEGRWWCFDRECRRGYLPDTADFYATDAFTDWALELLDRYRDAPVFLYLAYTAPHDPLQARPEDMAPFRGRYDAGYHAVAEARYRRQIALGIVDPAAPRAAPGWPDWEALSAEERADEARRMETYAAMIARLDANIGRVIARLEAQGQLDDTLFLFTSDNGASAEEVLGADGADIGAEHPIGSVGRWASLRAGWAEVANTPLRYFKNYSFNGGLLVPTLVHWPAGGVPAGAIRRDALHLIDIHATLLGIVGRRFDDSLGPDSHPALPLEGVDVSQLLTDGDGMVQLPDRALANRWGGGRMIRKAGWKLVSHAADTGRDAGEWELYDLERDPCETRNLARREPDRAAALAADYRGWEARVRSGSPSTSPVAD